MELTQNDFVLTWLEPYDWDSSGGAYSLTEDE